MTLLQRKTTKLGKGLGKTTGWIHRAALMMKNVRMVGGAEYDKVDDLGLHYKLQNGESKLIECDTVVVCAGQKSNRTLFNDLKDKGVPIYLIGGSQLAGELDAKRAILEGFELAARI